MHCPTCASPLPVGAMFCGECGRAVTSADVAAAAARRDDDGGGAGSQADPPAWQLRQPPRPSTSGDAPWWVRDRRVEQEPVEPREQQAREQQEREQQEREQPPREQRQREQPTGQRASGRRAAEEVPPAWAAPVAPAAPAVPPERTSDERPRPDQGEPVVPEPVVDREAEARARQTGATAAEPDDGSHAPAPDATAAASAPAPAPERAAPTPAPTPAPLRQPAAHADNGPRPTSAPLWTASLAPLRTETADEPPATPARDDVARPTTARPAAASVEGDRDDRSPGAAPAPDEDSVADVRAERETETESASAEAAAAESAPAPVADDEDAGHEPPRSQSPASGDSTSRPEPDEVRTPGGDDEPAASTSPADGPAASSSSPAAAPPVPLRAPAPEAFAGDTAPVIPLPRPGTQGGLTPAPVPLVEPGQQKVVEHCTHCGTLLHEDDIFCPECGAVVQSVALSFTGPIAPLPPEWRPGASAPSETASSPGETETEREPVRATEPEPASDVVPPTAPRHSPEPPLGRNAVPGRSADAPSATDASAAAAPPSLPPMPPSSTASPLAGLSSPDPRSRLATDDDDVDETRIVRRGPVGTEYLLQFSTGESVTVDGSGLLGRAPSPQPGERFDHLVRIVDPGKSVSKTHLEFGQELGALWVSDRWSGNGTVVRPHEQPARRVEPGTRVRVARGTRVEIGEQFFVVS
jgi:uncharacterized Zn finger protein (UPF0148 family)